MNFSEFLQKAKMVLKEDAGSEGLCYIVKFKGELPEIEGMTIENKSTNEAKITFTMPKDYGLALQVLKDAGVEIVGLELLF